MFLSCRFLATGESYTSLAYSFRVGKSTVANLVQEVCEAIWNELGGIYMKMPCSPNEWRLIAENFQVRWNFPLCIGAIDGKHVLMKSPEKSGSLYFNYKGSFSVVLMALVDANYKFIYINVGAYGRNSDGGIFSNSDLGKALANNDLHLPEDCVLPQAVNLGPLPYVTVGDEAFPLQKHLMRPFPGKQCSEDKQLFNYRLSRARRVVENAFGILASRWRLYHTKLAMRPGVVKKVVKATCVLHNMLQLNSNPADVPVLQEECQNQHIEGWKELPHIGNRACDEAIRVREAFKDYFCNSFPLSWQTDYVRRGAFDE